MSKFSPRTDLAIEMAEMTENEQKSINGVNMHVEEISDDIVLTWLNIENEEGEKNMMRPIGNYVTIESHSMRENSPEIHEKIIKTMSEALLKLCNLKEKSSVLVAGLGNRYVTPDALGPQVINKIFVTRHLHTEMPDELISSLRSVSAISPGVMGVTGIETGEILKGIVEKTKPELLIAIDALAARSFSRINSTIQMTDTGVCPGGGIGNKRAVINKDYIGVPVVAIGVPTVVDAATLVNDTMDRILDVIQTENNPFYHTLKNIDREEKYAMIYELFSPYEDNMFVTPKEVDAVVARLAKIISNSINIALHPGITVDDIDKYTA